MKLIFERSVPGRSCYQIGPSDVPEVELPQEDAREEALRLPEITEGDLSRHYTALARETFGINRGFFPLGSCTMKYNPKLHEAMSALPGFASLHPLMPEEDAQGMLTLIDETAQMLNHILGMEAFNFQPAAGAHGELLGILLIKKYHESRGDMQRKKVLIPESAHGTNPATAIMAGFEVINLGTNEEGNVDMDSLKEAIGDGSEIAGLMLTNPSTLGLFDPQVLEITKLVHDAGGLNYYDGANLNAIMGHCRPGDMGFDVVHLNIHKTFSTPHGGGGPGCGAVGCKDILVPYLPRPLLRKGEEGYVWDRDLPESVGRMKAFYGHMSIVVRVHSYLLSLGGNGLRDVSAQAVLNANYMQEGLKDSYPAAYDRVCMHEFVANMKCLKDETGVSALDVAKGMIDLGMHPPTMYFPLCVPEALMFEPTETESIETLDAAIDALKDLVKQAHEDPQGLHDAPKTTIVGRVDEVQAARKPIVRYHFEEE